jgi:flagellar hook-associated protein 2
VISIDGIDVTRSTNSITDALPGATLTLNSEHLTTDPDAKATVSLDTKELTTKVQRVVDAYNTVNNALRVQLEYNGRPRGENTLFGDSMLRGMQTALAATVSSGYGESNLAALGITRDKAGAMTLDSAKLVDAVAKDPDAMSRLFVTDGFARSMTALTDRYVGADGLLANKTTALTARQKVMQQQIDSINTNADNLQGRLEKQFTALEQAISKLRSQNDFLANALGG